MWLHFGYGNLGKSLIAPFLEKGVKDYVVVDLSIKSKDRKKLTLDYFGEKQEEIEVNVDIFDNLNIDKINIISTAVISTNIIHIVDKIQKVIDASSETVYVVSFENSTSALEILNDNLSGDFVVLDSVVDKIAISSTDTSALCEEFGKILIDDRISNAIDIKGYTTDKIKLEHDYKIANVNSLHASIAYAAYYLNENEGQSIKYISEAIDNDKFKEIFKDEIINSLKKYLLSNFEKEDVEGTLVRFVKSHKDTIQRVGRNPETKVIRLAPFKESSIYNELLEGNKIAK